MRRRNRPSQMPTAPHPLLHHGSQGRPSSRSAVPVGGQLGVSPAPLSPSCVTLDKTQRLSEPPLPSRGRSVWWKWGHSLMLAPLGWPATSSPPVLHMRLGGPERVGSWPKVTPPSLAHRCPPNPQACVARVGPNGLPRPDLVPIPAWPWPQLGVSRDRNVMSGLGALRALGTSACLSPCSLCGICASGQGLPPARLRSPPRPSAILPVHFIALNGEGLPAWALKGQRQEGQGPVGSVCVCVGVSGWG